MYRSYPELGDTSLDVWVVLVRRWEKREMKPMLSLSLSLCYSRVTWEAGIHECNLRPNPKHSLASFVFIFFLLLFTFFSSLYSCRIAWWGSSEIERTTPARRIAEGRIVSSITSIFTYRYLYIQQHFLNHALLSYNWFCLYPV